MLDKAIPGKYRFDAEGLAEEFSKIYFSSHKRQFPINPFQVLSDLKIPFVFRNLVRGLSEWKRERGWLTDTCLDGQDTFVRLLDQLGINLLLAELI